MSADASHEADYQVRVKEVGETTFLPNSTIEIIHEVDLAEPPRYAVFDFDGTLSLVREGWPEVMVPMMIEELQKTGTDESDEELSKIAYDFVMQLNGKQTIYQMIRLVEEIEKRGGKAEEPAFYKHKYHDLLMERITSRREDLRNGKADPRTMLVPGSFEVLQGLKDRGVEIFLASGTDENFVREECELLQIDKYFGPHIYGAQDDYKSFSKQMVIERILRENNVEGKYLIGFGDGYVEIDNIHEAGGTAIAVASNESAKDGSVDEWKRERLIGVGAHIVIPDYQQVDTLFSYLWKE
ncbi:MAG: HAD family hydrolase [Planctomycetaceae bacterium]|nr:HAD family hydrolase [Planctomycetaceae bacterium]